MKTIINISSHMQQEQTRRRRSTNFTRNVSRSSYRRSGRSRPRRLIPLAMDQTGDSITSMPSPASSATMPITMRTSGTAKGCSVLTTLSCSGACWFPNVCAAHKSGESGHRSGIDLYGLRFERTDNIQNKMIVNFCFELKLTITISINSESLL